MKTLHLTIITGTGIGLVVIMIFLLFLMTPNGSNQQNPEIHSSYENSSDVKIIVNDLNDTYLVGQRINFNLTTISKECSRPHLTLTEENGSMVWTSRPDAMFCDVISASWHTAPRHWTIDSGGLGNLQVNKTGIYKMTIQFLGKTLEKQFSVIQSNNLDCHKWTQSGWVTVPCSTPSLPH